MPADRKTSYKLPPTTIRDKLISQESRRAKSLEEQKRRRAQKISSARHLDTFAGLNLGGTDDEDDAEDEESPQASFFSTASVSQYASMLRQPEALDDMSNAITSFEKVLYPVNGQDSCFPTSAETPIREHEQDIESKKKSKKRKNKKRMNKASKWADKCMYAELLEMVSDDMWSQETLTGDEQHYNNGLPKDLETAFVALAPVPAGKRCLAVTYQSSGVAGVVPNTTLRSRLLGKTLIQRFPAQLPPLTILDCILDINWRDNGILHVLDVVKWKGQDVGDCEARFRFWWRDTRLAELTQMLPPSTASSHSHFVQSHHTHLKYRFPYPTTLIPVPYHTTTTLAALDEVVIPASRTVRELDVVVPSPPTSLDPASDGNAGMEVEPTSTPSMGIPKRFSESHIYSPTLPSFASPPDAPVPLHTHLSQKFRARIHPDGLLLYVAEASFEPGTSPLSSWVPISTYEQKTDASIELIGEPDDGTAKESPLDLFQRIIKQQLAYRMDMQICPFPQLPEVSTGSEGLVNETYMDL